MSILLVFVLNDECVHILLNVSIVHLRVDCTMLKYSNETENDDNIRIIICIRQNVSPYQSSFSTVLFLPLNASTTGAISGGKDSKRVPFSF